VTGYNPFVFPFISLFYFQAKRLFPVAKRNGRDSLQTRAGLLATDLQLLQTIFDQNREFLTAAHPYPHASFPGYSGEPVLQQLLRKKAEPAVEAWIDDNTNPAKVAKWDDGAETGLQEDEQQELWAFAMPTERQHNEHMRDTGVWDFDYSLAEKRAGLDKVVTGLRRKLYKYLDDDEDEGEESDDDEEMGEDTMPAAKPPNDPFRDVKGVDTSKPALSIEAWLKFMSIMAFPVPVK
jgi:mediator of RNA polymerase II transcription subunit 8